MWVQPPTMGISWRLSAQHHIPLPRGYRQEQQVPKSSLGYGPQPGEITRISQVVSLIEPPISTNGPRLLA